MCEQLIEYERAAAIQRAADRRGSGGAARPRGLRDAPDRLRSSPAKRRPSWRRSSCPPGARSRWCACAREVASGRVDLHEPDHERGWRRLRAIRGIGSWTVQKLALRGQGRLDQLPAGDLAYLKLVGA